MDSAPVAVDRSTLTFLEDSIVFAMRSFDDSDNDLSNALARSSLLTTTHYLEACSNACLDSLDLPSAFANDLDRLPFLSKFELFVRLRRKGTAFDRSRHEVQGVAELKRVRDLFVHPKAQRIVWEHWSEESSTSTSPRTNTTDLPKIAGYCCANDSVRALRACHDFLRYVFKDLSRMSAPKVNALLFSEDTKPDVSQPVFPYFPFDRLGWLKHHKIDIGYMRIGGYQL